MDTEEFQGHRTLLIRTQCHALYSWPTASFCAQLSQVTQWHGGSEASKFWFLYFSWKLPRFQTRN